jgi:hypothetical protein
MSQDIFPNLIGLFFGLMPIWITFVFNPLWTIGIRRITIIILVISNILFFSLHFFNFSLDSFTDMYARRITFVLLILYWTILAYRAYQLWPRQK